MEANTCCFIGHRRIYDIIDILEADLYKIVEELIVEQNVDTFLFWQ